MLHYDAVNRDKGLCILIRSREWNSNANEPKINMRAYIFWHCISFGIVR